MAEFLRHDVVAGLTPCPPPGIDKQYSSLSGAADAAADSIGGELTRR